MDFNSKLYNYCIHSEITTRKITNCYNLIANMQENYGGFTILQAICIKSYLKTMKRRLERKNDAKLLAKWNHYFSDFVQEVEKVVKEWGGKK